MNDHPEFSEPDVPMDGHPEDVIEYTQSLRREMVEHLRQNGVSNLIENSEVVLRSLKDMDAVEINRRRLGLDQRKTDSADQIADAMVSMARQLGKDNPFARKPDGSLPVPSVDESRLGDHEIVDGEDQDGIIAERSDQFISRMESNKEQEE